ncbi:MAG: hypothetical protein EA377_08235 [Phycisphaerales bacterium]|nr:MAG: hypothetical protein EA377_08235 [Phycisphaerales bacterium]
MVFDATINRSRLQYHQLELEQIEMIAELVERVDAGPRLLYEYRRTFLHEWFHFDSNSEEATAAHDALREVARDYAEANRLEW